MNIEYPCADPHALSVEEVLQQFQANAQLGLTKAEADSRTREFGPNVYQVQKQKSIWMVLLRQFKSPIVYLLLVAAAVTFYFQNLMEAYAILVVILINALIGFLMELQARSSMNALRKMDVTRSRVVRDGTTVEIASEEIAPGDLLVLEAGDVVPGDGRLVECNRLQCDESSLTGEALPTGKNTEKLSTDTPLGDRLNMVFKGTSVMNGNGKAIITGIARHTELGTITSLVEASEEKATPLDRKISALSRKLIWVTLTMTTVFAITGVMQGKNWVLILETSIALAVAAFPEGLPIVATVALAYGMLLMARRNAIVKKLSSVETLGSTNVILTDKTGTLTENKIFVDTLSFPGESMRVGIENNVLKLGKEQPPENFQKLRLIGALCNNAAPKPDGDKQKLLGDPIELALVRLADASGASAEEMKGQYPRIAEVPFSSDTKIMGTLHKGPGGYFVAAKGSVEHLLKKCNSMWTGSAGKALQVHEKEKILSDSEKMAASGLRVLAFAFREEAKVNEENYLNDLAYVGMVGFLDPPRMEIRDAILSCRKAGIKIVMITGDHPMTALNIAKKVGLADEEDQNVITGSELPDPESVTNEWTKKILSTAVFARTTPRQKLDIVGIFQKAGNIVAMTGDGVNDAPALKKADIGIAMGLRGTQVAKEASTIVLKDDSFTSIALAVSHGREIFQNIQKFVIYLVSCNLSEIFIVTGLGFVAPASVLLPLQILFLNMVTDIFPALALGVGKGDNSVMDRPPRNPKDSIISNKDWAAVAAYSAAMTAAVIAAVLYCRQTMTTSHETLNNVAFITLAFSQLFHVFNMASNKSNWLANDVTKNKFIWLALFICTALMVLVYLVPQIRQVLGLEVLRFKIWAVAVVASLLPLLLVQCYRLIAGRLLRKTSSTASASPD